MHAQDLVLIRHEEAEGNVAMVKSKFSGDDSGFTTELRSRPSSTWRLTDCGRERCTPLRRWVEAHIPFGKMRLATSPSARTVETANLLLPQGLWEKDEMIRGQLWGGIERIPWSEWLAYCQTHGHNQIPSGFDRAYPNGEALAEVWKRTREFIDSLNGNTLAVTHGEVILTARMILESVDKQDYQQLERNGNHIRNGHVLWYSKRDPCTGEVSDMFSFKRMWYDSIDTGWVETAPR